MTDAVEARIARAMRDVMERALDEVRSTHLSKYMVKGAAKTLPDKVRYLTGAYAQSMHGRVFRSGDEIVASYESDESVAPYAGYVEYGVPLEEPREKKYLSVPLLDDLPPLPEIPGTFLRPLLRRPGYAVFSPDYGESPIYLLLKSVSIPERPVAWQAFEDVFGDSARMDAALQNAVEGVLWEVLDL